MTPGAPRARPSPADLERAAVLGARVPDIVGPGLDILFCGINPGRWSGAVGHHFAHPGNRFWKALHLAGCTDRLLRPDEEQCLPAVGIGVTNLVARTTATAAELTPDELRRGGAALRRTVARLGPRSVAFLGLGAYRTAFGARRASLGEQAEPLEGAVVWVLPNPSGLQAHYPLEVLVAQLQDLCRRVGRAPRRHDGAAGPPPGR